MKGDGTANGLERVREEDPATEEKDLAMEGNWAMEEENLAMEGDRAMEGDPAMMKLVLAVTMTNHWPSLQKRDHQAEKTYR